MRDRDLKKLLHPGDQFMYTGYGTVYTVVSVGESDEYGSMQAFAVDNNGYQWWTADDRIIILDDEFITWVKDVRREAEECQT